MTTAILPSSQVPLRMTQRRFTVAEYHKLGEIGVLTPADRCELIHGFIVEKAVINPPHANAVRRLSRLLMALVPDDVVIGVQSPITLSDSEPEPDIVLAVGPDDNYTHAHPGPKDINVLIEVADSTLEDDQTIKLVMYARERIPQYWIVNIPERRIEVYTQPRGGRNPTYRAHTDYGPDDDVPVVVGGTTLGTIPVRELLP